MIARGQLDFLSVGVLTHFTVFASALALTGLEKMAAEQDEMMKLAEQELERVQDAAKETAQVIMGFGGKHQLNMDLCRGSTSL